MATEHQNTDKLSLCIRAGKENTFASVSEYCILFYLVQVLVKNAAFIFHQKLI